MTASACSRCTPLGEASTTRSTLAVREQRVEVGHDPRAGVLLPDLGDPLRVACHDDGHLEPGPHDQRRVDAPPRRAVAHEADAGGRTGR